MSVLSIVFQLPIKFTLCILKHRGLTIGKNFYMGRGCTLDSSLCWLISIGDDVTFTTNITILAHDASTKQHLNYTRIGKVNIGNRVFVGAGSIILPGVTIGDNVVIGAGSVVTKDVPSGSIVTGNPAKITGELDDFLKRKKTEMSQYPIFEKEFTNEGNVNKDRKVEALKKMKDRIGYIY